MSAETNLTNSDPDNVFAVCPSCHKNPYSRKTRPEHLKGQCDECVQEYREWIKRAYKWGGRPYID